MRLKEKIILLGLAATLTGCAATPTQYLSLAPESASTHSASSSLQGRGLPVLVAHVQMPADIDRLYLTTRSGKHRMQVAGHVRWVAPLGGMAQKVLAQDIAAQLPEETVLMPGDPLPDGPYLQVTVNVQNFVPSSNGQVILNADWFIHRMPTNVLAAQGRNQLLQNADPSSPADQAAAMSQLLGKLAQILASHL